MELLRSQLGTQRLTAMGSSFHLGAEGLEAVPPPQIPNVVVSGLARAGAGWAGIWKSWVDD